MPRPRLPAPPRTPIASRRSTVQRWQKRIVADRSGDLRRAAVQRNRTFPKPPTTFDHDKQYRVALNQVIQVGGRALRPSAEITVSGRFANKIASFITGAVEK